ncbi:MAG: glycosyltransferase family 2 protein [Ferruginibacter sp.]
MTDIVIVNWNGGDYLKHCVNSLLNTDNKTLISTIFIIDNNSSDQSVEKISPDPRISIIRNNANVGFAKACNQGFKLCTASYILLLNPDAQLLPSTLQDASAFMDHREDVDVLGCQLLDDNGTISKSCARFPTARRIFFDTLGLSTFFPSLFKPAILMLDWDHKESRFVDQVMGAFMFMRRSIFDKVGYFDERFFVYYEELDFSKRLAALKGKSYYNTDIKAIHSGQGTTASVKAFRLFLNLRSRLKYAKKHFSIPGFLLVWLTTFFIDPLTRTAMLIVKGRFKETGSVFKGYALLIGDGLNIRN